MMFACMSAKTHTLQMDGTHHSELKLRKKVYVIWQDSALFASKTFFQKTKISVKSDLAKFLFLWLIIRLVRKYVHILKWMPFTIFFQMLSPSMCIMQLCIVLKQNKNAALTIFFGGLFTKYWSKLPSYLTVGKYAGCIVSVGETWVCSVHPSYSFISTSRYISISVFTYYIKILLAKNYFCAVIFGLLKNYNFWCLV